MKFVRRNILGQLENAADKSFTMGEMRPQGSAGVFCCHLLFDLLITKTRKEVSMRAKRSLALLLCTVFVMACMMFVSACAGKERENLSESVQYSELVSEGKENNTFAELFSIEHFSDGHGRSYSRIEIYDKDKALNSAWLLLPEGVTTVSGLPEKTNLMTASDRENIMVSSASTMSLINAMGALDKVPMTTSDTTWRIEEIKNAIESGQVQEVGKYNAPDYEKILTINAEKNVTFAVFSTMIDYEPEVEGMLSEECGLRIMRDQSSSEGHPLARTEWIKIYGEIFDMREQSDEVFNEQVDILNETLEKIGEKPETERKSVLIFYTTSSKDTYYVRNAADYVTELVNLAGGKQVSEIGAGKSGNTKMDQETFVATCSQADYVLYNWTSGASGVSDETLQGLMDARLGEWFKDFKAYKDGNVWRTSNDFYQKMDKMGEMVMDIYNMLYNDDAGNSLTYVNRLTNDTPPVEEPDEPSDVETGCGANLHGGYVSTMMLLLGAVVFVLVKRKSMR